MERTFVDVPQDVLKRHEHMLEGINHHSGDTRLNQLEQNKMAVMLDNSLNDLARQAKMSVESLQKILAENTVAASAPAFVKTMLPLIRRVYPAMISRELISVQPMTQPTTKIFYYDIQRTDNSSLADAIDTNKTYADNAEYDPSNPSANAIAEINLKLTDTSVSAVEKKLKAKWTTESQQDIMAYHGINVENDMTAALGTEITREWDRVILADLLDKATGGASIFSQTVPVGISYTDRKVWMEGLYEAMINVDTSIFKKRYRKTNWVVFPADVAGFIEKMAGFKADPTGDNSKIIASGGRYFMGTLNNRWRCYSDPFFPSNKVLMGYNGADWLDTAYVFSPYILAYFSDTFTDPNTFNSVRAIMSRAAMKCTVPDLLGYVTVSGS